MAPVSRAQYDEARARIGRRVVTPEVKAEADVALDEAVSDYNTVSASRGQGFGVADEEVAVAWRRMLAAAENHGRFVTKG